MSARTIFKGLAILFTVVSLFISRSGFAVEAEGGLDKLAEDNNMFALQFYRRLAEDEKKNIIFSPYSISTAFAMTYAGARGTTESQMAEAMNFTLGQEGLHQAFAELGERIREIQSKGEVELETANSLWPCTGYDFREQYLNLIEELYGTSITPLDYVNDSESARKTINQWVEKKTRERIKNLIGPGVLSPLTRLVLVNAIYFKGDWQTQFNEENTREAAFHLSPDKTVEVPMMYQKNQFLYGSMGHLELLEMPYQGEDLSMLILLPGPEVGLSGLREKLNTESLEKWRRQAHRQEVEVYLPRFKSKYKIRLDKTMVEMGMKDAFNREDADFSGMYEDSLYISAALHKAFIQVNEEGSEAAAATAVVMKTTSLPPPPTVFRADRPFVFIIRENDSGSILFLGQQVDPREEENK